MENAQGLLTVADLSRRLQVKKSWLYQNHLNLGLPSIKLGNLLRFDAADVEAFLEARKSGRKPSKVSVTKTDSARDSQCLRGV